MKNRNKLINTIQKELSNASSNPIGKQYRADELVAIFSTDYTFMLAYTEVVEPRYSSLDFKLRGIYGDSLIDKAIDPINPDYMKSSLRWYNEASFSDVTTQYYLSIDVSELVPPNFLYDGMIYDGDLLQLHHSVMQFLLANPDTLDFVGENILCRKKNTLFTKIYETIGNMAALPKWPQFSVGFLGIFKNKNNIYPYADERDARDMLGLFNKNGNFQFVMTEYGQKRTYNYGCTVEHSYWYLRNALRQNIIATSEEENSITPKRIPKWCAEEIDDFLGMPVAASKIIPPQILRCGRFINVVHLKQIENSINCLLEEQPELLEPFFPKPVKSNLFDALSLKHGCTTKVLQETPVAQIQTSIDGIQELDEEENHINTLKKRL